MSTQLENEKERQTGQSSSTSKSCQWESPRLHRKLIARCVNKNRFYLDRQTELRHTHKWPGQLAKSTLPARVLSHTFFFYSHPFSPSFNFDLIVLGNWTTKYVWMWAFGCWMLWRSPPAVVEHHSQTCQTEWISTQLSSSQCRCYSIDLASSLFICVFAMAVIEVAHLRVYLLHTF